MDMYWYWLCSIPGLGRKKIWELVNTDIPPDGLFIIEETHLKKMNILKEEQLAAFINSRDKKAVTDSYQRMERSGIRFISYHSPDFPEKLREIPDPPPCLYVKGRLPSPDQPSVAIVGARKCSEYGAATARRFAAFLSSQGVQVISGMARGIDSLAHIGALRGSTPTYAVLGSGVDVCYPRENRGLYADILAAGGILSESVPQTPPQAYLFPARNRLISGLADAVLIVEAEEKSGSLITADMALEQGRDVFAVPGRLTDRLSSGCNRLIRQGAAIVTKPDDLLEELPLFVKKSENISKKPHILLERIENLVYSCVDFHPKNLDQLVVETNLTVSEIMNILLTLQLKGYIIETSRNYYARAEE